VPQNSRVEVSEPIEVTSTRSVKPVQNILIKKSLFIFDLSLEFATLKERHYFWKGLLDEE